jgi:hypothetical protein
VWEDSRAQQNPARKNGISEEEENIGRTSGEAKDTPHHSLLACMGPAYSKPMESPAPWGPNTLRHICQILPPPLAPGESPDHTFPLILPSLSNHSCFSSSL